MSDNPVYQEIQESLKRLESLFDTQQAARHAQNHPYCPLVLLYSGESAYGKNGENDKLINSCFQHFWRGRYQYIRAIRNRDGTCREVCKDDGPLAEQIFRMKSTEDIFSVYDETLVVNVISSEDYDGCMENLLSDSIMLPDIAGLESERKEYRNLKKILGNQVNTVGFVLLNLNNPDKPDHSTEAALCDLMYVHYEEFKRTVILSSEMNNGRFLPNIGILYSLVARLIVLMNNSYQDHCGMRPDDFFGENRFLTAAFAEERKPIGDICKAVFSEFFKLLTEQYEKAVPMKAETLEKRIGFQANEGYPVLNTFYDKLEKEYFPPKELLDYLPLTASSGFPGDKKISEYTVRELQKATAGVFDLFFEDCYETNVLDEDSVKEILRNSMKKNISENIYSYELLRRMQDEELEKLKRNILSAYPDFQNGENILLFIEHRTKHLCAEMAIFFLDNILGEYSKSTAEKETAIGDIYKSIEDYWRDSDYCNLDKRYREIMKRYFDAKREEIWKVLEDAGAEVLKILETAENYIRKMIQDNWDGIFTMSLEEELLWRNQNPNDVTSLFRKLQKDTNIAHMLLKKAGIVPTPQKCYYLLDIRDRTKGEEENILERAITEEQVIKMDTDEPNSVSLIQMYSLKKDMLNIDI